MKNKLVVTSDYSIGKCPASGQMSGKCMFLGSVSSQQRFGVTDVKALGVSQLWGLGQTMLQLSGLERTVYQLLDKSVLQLHVIALFYLDNSRKIHPRGVRVCRPKDMKRRTPQRAGQRETPSTLAFFICFFSTPGPGLCELGQPGVFVLLEVLTPVLRPSFVLCLWAFLFSVFQPPPSQTPVSYSNYLTITLNGMQSIKILNHYVVYLK